MTRKVSKASGVFQPGRRRSRLCQHISGIRQDQVRSCSHLHRRPLGATSMADSSPSPCHRIARRVIVDGEKHSKSKVAAGLLGSTRLNLAGMGATIIGLQAS